LNFVYQNYFQDFCLHFLLALAVPILTISSSTALPTMQPQPVTDFRNFRFPEALLLFVSLNFYLLQ
jgi:hypothetical protein